MIKNNRLFTLLLSVLAFTAHLAAPQYALAEGVQYENQLVEKINIDVQGPNSITPFHERSIKSRIKTKEGHTFSQLEFDRDLKALIQDYDRIDPELESIGGKLYISLKVWPKPTIRNIQWNGNIKVATSDLQKELAIAPCSVFNRHAFNQAFHKLKGYYIKNGFFEAQLSYDVMYIEETNEVDIIICINEGRAGRIKEICFEGVTKIEEEDLLDMMYTRKYNFFLSWLTEEGTYHDEAIQQDQFLILNFLQNKGYADAEVCIDVCEAKEKDRIVIIIRVTKGPRYKIGKVTFEGNTIFDDAAICNNFKFKIGCPYSPENIRNTIQSIMDMYGRRGYIETFVNYEPKLECDECVYSLHFTIDEGEQYRVGLIRVFGNCSTQTNVILHEILLTPGEVFNNDNLKRTEMRLRNIGYFKNVNVYAVRTENSPSCLGGNYRDIHIEVEETTTGSFGAFAGFSTSENLFGGFNVTERNFNIAGLGSFLNEGGSALRGGGEFAQFNATIGQKSRKYVVSWTKPYFMDTPWSVGFDLENANTRYISDDYQIDSLGYTLFGTYNINAFVNVGLHYRITHSKVHLDHKHINEPGLIKASKNCGLISAVGSTLSYNSTNSMSRPTNGFKSRFEYELAGVGGDFCFFSVGYINTYYWQLGERDVLKFRADALFVQPFGKTHFSNLPLDERLYLGGEYEIRGYRPYRLGPKFEKIKDHKEEESDDPEGGISLQMLSLEYQRRIFSRLDSFLFCDAGYLSDRKWNFGPLYTSIGIGCRLHIMDNGPPLTIGLGFPLRATDSTNVKKFFMNVGGSF